MSALLLTPFLGRNLTVAMTPQDVSASSVLTDNVLGTCTFTGRLDAAGSEAALTTENISPMDVNQANPVWTEQAYTYNLTEIQQALAPSTTANSLDKCIRTSFYQKLVLTWKDNSASPATIRTETVYALILSYSPSYNKGKSPTTMRLQAVAIGASGVATANPVIS